jgi:hypothetical protein
LQTEGITDARETRVIACLASDHAWRELVDAADPAARLVRAGTMPDSNYVGDAERLILVTDLASGPTISRPAAQGLALRVSYRTVIWAPFSNALVDPVLHALAGASADVLWSDRGRELPRLTHLLTFADLPGACARVGHALAEDLSQLPPDLRSSVLALLGNMRLTVRPNDLTRRLPFVREKGSVSRREVGRLIRLVGHARGWDALRAGATVTAAAAAALFGPTRAYSDAFKLLIGSTPSDANETLATAEFVERLLASVPPVA